ncbi:MAG: hypothetical protein HY840_00975 [Bacteroidetes bacterium]|nr:hypothetical protein [Bacteroidota bacterium]
MKIIINDHRKIFAIQKEFSEQFKKLKIEFFSRPHKSGAPSSKKMMKRHSKTLGECRVVHTKGMLSITPGMTVADLEQNFQNIYGLSVQVFRKSGNSWLETTATDGWTLEEQNKYDETLSAYSSQKELIAHNQEA